MEILVGAYKNGDQNVEAAINDAIRRVAAILPDFDLDTGSRQQAITYY